LPGADISGERRAIPPSPMTNSPTNLDPKGKKIIDAVKKIEIDHGSETVLHPRA